MPGLAISPGRLLNSSLLQGEALGKALRCHPSRVAKSSLLPGETLGKALRGHPSRLVNSSSLSGEALGEAPTRQSRTQSKPNLNLPPNPTRQPPPAHKACILYSGFTFSKLVLAETSRRTSLVDTPLPVPVICQQGKPNKFAQTEPPVGRVLGKAKWCGGHREAF